MLVELVKELVIGKEIDNVDSDCRSGSKHVCCHDTRAVGVAKDAALDCL